jgi:UDP-glucuronate 4-epimerase
MNILVTGCAGFIGSALCRRLLKLGYSVTGIDCFVDNYEKAIKKKNLHALLTQKNFTMLEKNILDVDWTSLLTNIDYVFHQAAVPGVRTSWGSQFSMYVNNNIMATQLLLEAAKQSPVKKFIYASSSSIYGITVGKTPEMTVPRPHSPYGVTKLAGEQLCNLYADNYAVPTVSLRYFTVYGPGQRPDMAFHQFIRSMLKGETIHVYGDGTQSRDFTYIEDAIDANLKAMHSPKAGEVYNIGGQSNIVLRDAIDLLGDLMGIEPKVKYLSKQAGDPPHTWADNSKAKRELAYSPAVPLKEGLLAEIEYVRDLYT